MTDRRTTTFRGRALRASLLAGGAILAFAGAAFADAPVATSIDVDVDGMTVTVSGDWAWQEKQDPCGPGTSTNRAVGWAADWGDGWDGNFVQSKGAPKGTGYHMGGPDDNLVSVSDANDGRGDCGAAAPIPLRHNDGPGVVGTWGPISHTYAAPGTYEICVVTYDVRYYGSGENLRLKDAKQLVAGGRDHNRDNSAEKEYLDSGLQCAGAGTPVIVEIAEPVLELVKKATEPEFTPLAGSTVAYRFRVKNVGDGPTTSPITIDDPMVPNATCPDLSTVGDEDADLDPGETIVCTGTYAVTEGDIIAGSIENTAIARSGPVASEPSSVTVIEAPTIQLLLDESGSIASRAGATIRAYNAILDRWRDRHPMAVYGLTLFSSEIYEHRYDGLPIADVPYLNARTFVPEGYTPLYDATVRAIRDLADRGPASRVIFYIFTDGEDNASKNQTAESTAAVIRRHEVRRGWTFRYRGAALATISEAVARLR